MKTTPEVAQVFKWTITFNQLPFFVIHKSCSYFCRAYVSKRSDILKLNIRLKKIKNGTISIVKHLIFLSNKKFTKNNYQYFAYMSSLIFFKNRPRPVGTFLLVKCSFIVFF